MLSKQVILRTASVVSVALLSLTSALAADGDAVRLVDAVKSRDFQTARALVDRHVDVNARRADGATALAWAAHWDAADLAARLVAAGADVNAANELGVTPLSLASVNGSAAMVDLLLKAGANPNLARATGETPLMTAARSGSVAVVTALLARGAEANARDADRGQTALMWAVSQQHLDVAAALIERGADLHARSKSEFTPLLFAARVGSVDLTRLLLDKGADVNEAARDGNAALNIAIGSMVLSTASSSIASAGAATLQHPRGSAAHEAVAKLLLDRGADPNANKSGYTALHLAMDAGSVDLVKALVAHGASPNARLTRELPKPPGDLSYTRLVGATPFWLAAKAGEPEMMRLLVASGADPKLTATDNTTPLMAAAGLGWVDGQSRVPEATALETIAIAIESGADVNAVNKAGETALHGAAYRGANRAVEYLVRAGARLDAKDKLGQTPIAIAEGLYVGGAFVAHKDTADLLRKLESRGGR